MPKAEQIILTGLIMGTLARFFLLKADFRQYPSYPQGYIIHLTLGAIAAGLGSVVVPAILKRDYAAVTFLTVAIQQFREVRKMERESLAAIEENELVKRGSAYVEEISKRFESRNYIALLTALGVTWTIYLSKQIWLGVAAGIILILLSQFTIKGMKVSDIAHVKPAEIIFDGPYLKIEDIVIMNVGLEKFRDKIKEQGKAVLIVPKGHTGAISLSNTGQRQAILHDVVSILGIRRDVDEPEYIPMARRNTNNGNVALLLLTTDSDVESIMEIVRRCPMLETTHRQPVKSLAGRTIFKD